MAGKLGKEKQDAQETVLRKILSIQLLGLGDLKLHGSFKEKYLGFPGGLVKNLPCNARDTGFDPWFEISHAAEQLSPCITTIEPMLQSPRATTTEPTCFNY